jgi:hypothetical integral membrane protein (TIGR02206 family)
MTQLPLAAGSYLLSAEHLITLAATAALSVALPVAARRHPGPWTRIFSRGLAAILLASFLVYPLVVGLDGSYELDFDLPLHLTDAAALVAAIALWNLRARPFELAYFWGLTASLQAVLTPSLDGVDRFPSFIYWHYFMTHSGVVVAATFLAFGLGLTARRGAVRRVFLATVAWAGVAAAGNLVTGGNYMFLRERPQTASLLDYMGPWPWYLFSAAILALGLFALLDLPFRRRRQPA